jgi:hypothetical protein
MHFQALAAFAALAATVSAHGYVDNVTVAGVFYEVSERHQQQNTVTDRSNPRDINHTPILTPVLYQIESSALSKATAPS